MSITIALDAMGGDHAPGIVVRGASLFSQKNPHCNFLFFGIRDQLECMMRDHPHLEGRATIIHTEKQIANTTKPSVALRQAAGSSMGGAIKAVAEKKAHAVVSSGNTGALMAIGRMFLRSLDGVDRPAIAKTMPSINGKVVVLDLGANAECRKEHLLQFALMGEALARHTGDFKDGKMPTVGLLNIGSEASKGLAILQETAEELQTLVNFYGFVEGDDIAKGTTDVIVTDGFTGNVALKTIEGTAKLIRHFLKEALSSSPFGKLGYFIAKSAFKKLANRMDPRMYNGGILLGLKGIVVKSHGGTDDVGFSEAIRVAFELASSHTPLHDGVIEPPFNKLIQENIHRIERL